MDMSKKNYISTLFVFLLFTTSLQAQTNEANSDLNYYESWEGTWHRVENGQLSDMPSFVVKRSLYPSAFEEYWMGAGGGFSMAWRAWDSRTQQWDFAWMSTDGLFQTWEGRKVDGIWYMYKTFIINGNEVLSRQAFIPKGVDELTRTSEHSTDGGKTWRLRFKEEYKKMNEG